MFFYSLLYNSLSRYKFNMDKNILLNININIGILKDSLSFVKCRFIG